jgi:hypothetical protein
MNHLFRTEGAMAARAFQLALIVFLAWGGLVQARPSLVQVIPENLALGVPPASPVVFTFSVAMDPVHTAAEFLDPLNPLSPLSTVASWNAAGTQLTCTPVPPFPSNHPIVWNLSGRDPAGATLVGVVDGFFTTGSGGAAVASVTPANGSIGVASSTSVKFRFSTAMNPAAMTVLFYDIESPQTPLSMGLIWGAGNTELNCSPTTLWLDAHTYVWTVNGVALDGGILSSANGVFTVSSAAPLLLSVNPADGATEVPTDSSVVFRFSTPMNPATTAVSFRDASVPLLLKVTPSWNSDLTRLTCVPVSSFPAGRSIQWSLEGYDANGKALRLQEGRFGTAAEGPVFPVSTVLISRGERWDQPDAEQFELVGPEFLVLASAALEQGVRVVAPVSGATHIPQATGWPEWREWRENSESSAQSDTNHPPGPYTVTAFAVSGSATASLPLTDGILPAPVQVSDWQGVPHVVLGEPWTLRWTRTAGGSAVDYIQLQIGQDDAVLFATPLPGQSGALTGLSNVVTIPATAFGKVGGAEVRITAYTFATNDTQSIPGITLQAARHRATFFSLRIVDGSTPPPTLITTNVTEVAAGEPFLNPLFARNGVRPLRYELVGGSLPPGLELRSRGMLDGLPGSIGTYVAQVRITDLLGRSVTQSLSVSTVPAAPENRLTIENLKLFPGSGIGMDLVAAVGTPCTVEKSADLKSWTRVMKTNLTTGRITLLLPTDGEAVFFRATGGIAGLPEPRPFKVNPILNPAARISGAFDEMGGILRLTNSAGYRFNLEIPPGALSGPETITMTDVAEIGGLPLSGGLRAAVLLEPEGLVFDQPARLDLTLPAGIDAKNLLAFGSRPDGSQFALQPGFQTNRTLSLHLWHFSMAGAGQGTAADAEAQSQNAPQDPESAMAQEVAKTLAACKADPACSDKPVSENESLYRLYVRIADTVIIPKLQKAASDDALLGEAINAWLRWLKELSLLGLVDDFSIFGNGGMGDLEKKIRKCGNLAAKAILGGITRACDDCIRHDIVRIYRMMELAKFANMLGLNYEDQFWSCLRRCMVFEVDIESEIIVTRGGTTYTTHTKAKAKLHPLSLGESDPGMNDILRLLRVFQGSGQWKITNVESIDSSDCSILSTPASGQFHIPFARIRLYKQRQVWIPGESQPRTVGVYDPDLELNVRSDRVKLPAEGRRIFCPKAPVQPVENLFGPVFLTLHNDEVVLPEGIDAEILGGPVFRMTGFATGGPEGVIFSKPYVRSINTTVENTLIEMRHKPQ